MVAIVLALALTGCPKRPGTMGVSAPAPGGPAAPSASGPPAAATQAVEKPAAPGGSPAASVPTPAEFAPSADLLDIHFDFDKADLRPGDGDILATNARWLKSNPGVWVLVEGNCDERGTVEYNLALGQRRAKTAMDFLMTQGVHAERIITISYGKEQPVCTEHSEPCWAKNRRDHFLVKAR
ncbi:MAG TPA: peptidoglycan-associated lipoprotein Pal [Candidatus Methylomirabilis sp.]|nr:peptidoglycan-associated lipoprotein Pal [Candidatus Methylomirabilis sp.]